MLLEIYIFVTQVFGALADRIFSYIVLKSIGKAGANCKVQYPCVFRNIKNITLGDRVRVGKDCFVATENYPNAKLCISDNVWIGKRCFIDFSGGIDIGNGTTISEGVIIYTHDHGRNPRANSSAKKLIIGENVWLARNAVILQSVDYIGNNSIVSAGSIVTKNVEDFEIVGGNPSRVIGSNFKKIELTI
jgi:acetyltransferase-like isoleucine patch superfamily enzyme